MFYLFFCLNFKICFYFWLYYYCWELLQPVCYLQLGIHIIFSIRLNERHICRCSNTLSTPHFHNVDTPKRFYCKEGFEVCLINRHDKKLIEHNRIRIFCLFFFKRFIFCCLCFLECFLLILKFLFSSIFYSHTFFVFICSLNYFFLFLNMRHV